MAENDVQNDSVNNDSAKDGAQEKSGGDSFRDRVGAFLSNAATIGKSAFETVKESVVETAARGKEFVEDRRRDSKANDIYARLGKKVYKLVSRDEMTVPECCEKYIAELNELYADDAKDDDGGCGCGCGDSCSCGGTCSDGDAKGDA